MQDPRARSKTERGPRVGDVPFVALTLAGVIAMSAIGAILFLQSRDSGVEHERRAATRRAVLAGRAIVAGLLTARDVRGNRATLTELDRVVREHVLRDGVVRVKLWRSDGLILYSDEPRLIGATFPLGAEERGLLAAGTGAMSELSDLSRPENRFERNYGRLLEVYTPLQIRAGSTLLFEEYQRFEPTAESGGQFVLSVLPALGIGLFLLELANLILARWVAIRLRREDRQRAALLARALDATNRERRRIAADLHDGVVQDISAAALTVTTTTRTLDRSMVGATAIRALEAAAETMRVCVSTLRTTLMDFYPPNLESQGIEAALGGLTALARSRGLMTELEVADGFGAPLAVQGALFRVAQEATRNVAAHAQASRVAIRAGADAGNYWLEVWDDGVGFDPATAPANGHIGLQVARDLLADLGGTLSISSTAGKGTIVRAELARQEAAGRSRLVAAGASLVGSGDAS